MIFNSFTLLVHLSAFSINPLVFHAVFGSHFFSFLVIPEASLILKLLIKVDAGLRCCHLLVLLIVTILNVFLHE
jgi:hypothetical protein